MKIIVGLLFTAVIVLSFLLYLVWGIFRVSVLERRNHRKEELDFLSRNAKTGQIVFLGDSITHYCPVEEFYGEWGLRVYNRGIASETSEDARRRLDGNVLALRPSKLVILLGCNDIGEKMTAEQTVNNIKEIIKRAREKCPGIRIILQAVYSIRERGNSLPARFLIGGRTCEKIRKLNRELEALAEREEVLFVNMEDILSDADGQLKKEYTADGLHVNEKAYQEIAGRLGPLLNA